MKLRELRLSTRITISALMIVTAGALILAYVENTRIRDEFTNERRARLKNNLETEQLRLTQAIDTLRQDVVFLSETPPISGIMRAARNQGHDPLAGDNHKVWTERLQITFAAFTRAHPNYFQVRYIGVADRGREIVRVSNHEGKIEITPPDRLETKGDRDYFEAALKLKKGQVYFSKIDLAQEWNVSALLRRPSLRAATPVFTPSGKIFGVVVVNLDVSSLLKSATKALPAGTQAYITDSSGEYLLHPEPQKTLAPGTGSRDRITSYFPLIKPMFDPQAPEYLPLQVAETTAGSAWVTAERIHFDPLEPSRFLLLFYSIPNDVAEKQVARIPAQNIVSGFIVMALVGLLALLVLRRTFHPLEEIAAAADKIAAGNHDVQLSGSSNGEIGSLANALKSMLAQLSQREKLLLESEAKYRRLHESMMDAFVMVDMSGKLIEFNNAFRDMLGYSAPELRRMPYDKLAPEKWHEFEKRIALEQVVPHGQSPVYEKEYIRRDGTIFPVEIKAFLLRNENNQPEAIWAIVRDITERKRTEERSRQDAERIRILLNSVAEGIYGVDIHGNCTFINPAGLHLLGYQEEAELLGKHMHDLIHHTRPDGSYYPAAECRLYHCLNTKENIHVDDEVFWRKDGSFFPVDYWSRPTLLNGEQGGVVTFLDITERKQAEDKIVKAAEKFRVFFESISDAVFICDMEGHFIQVNHSACERLGYSQEELLQMSPADIDTPEFAALVPERFKLLKEKGALIFESAQVRKDGTVIPIELSAEIIDYEGKPTVMSVARDISLRKRAEEELRRFFNLIPELACIASTDGHFLKINAAWKDILGYTEQELLSTTFLDFIHPDDSEATIKEIEQLMRGIAAFHFVNRYRHKDGSYRWLEWKAIPVESNTEIYATARDITERMQTEDQLRKSTAEIADLYNHAPCGYHSLGKDGEILLMNDTELSWLGYTRGEVIGKMKWMNLLVPANILAFKKAHLQFVQQGFIQGFEAEIIRKDGTTFTGLVNASAIYDRNGNYVMSRSTVIDITERKRVKRQLQELSAHLQTVREEEKASIAREIHDDLGGTLTALKIEAYRLESDLSASKAAKQLLNRVASMSQLLDNAVGVTRRVITDLRPTILDDLGLLAALEWQASQFQKHTRIRCRVNCVEDKGGLNKQYSIALFRVFQETLTNVARHSGASKVEVEYHCDGEEVTLSISDNGRGAPEGHVVASNSFGLRGMNERVEQLGGNISFNSTLGGGFNVTVILPLPAESKRGTKT